jgi:membrane-associated PAP2 superfamily phosphatase
MLVATLLLSGLFLLFPGLDPWFSGLFYDPATGFPASDQPLLKWLRSLADDTVWVIVIASLASLLAKLVLPERPSLIPPRSSLFLLSTLIIGPGILVNAVLKANWGRPRPFMIEQFGGDLPFVGVWRITDFCSGNCSFVSGEASSAIWLLALALVVPIAWRNRVAVITVFVAFVFSLNRVAFGAHFLSDVLLSWTLTLTVIAVVHHYLFVRPLPGLSNAEIERALTRAGRRIRHPFGSWPEGR